MAYKDISRGVRLKADHDKYLIWLNKDTEARQTAFEAVNDPKNPVRTTRTAGYITHFTSTGTPLIYLEARLIADEQKGRGETLATTLRGILAEYTITVAEKAALTTPNVLEGVKFTPAKLTIIQRVTTAADKKASRITGRKYYRHENDSVTGSFGKKVAADTYTSVCAAIQAATTFKALFTGSENNLASRFRFKPEKY